MSTLEKENETDVASAISSLKVEASRVSELPSPRRKPLTPRKVNTNDAPSATSSLSPTVSSFSSSDESLKGIFRKKAAKSTSLSSRGASGSENSIMIFSPPKAPLSKPLSKQLAQPPDAPVSAPVLLLGKFSESIWLDFGHTENIVGIPRSLSFKLQARESDALVEVCKVPSKKGFSLDFESTQVNKGETKVYNVTWTPLSDGGVREVVHLKLPGGRLQITVHGTATGGTSKPPSKVNRRVSIKKASTAVDASNIDPSSIARKIRASTKAVMESQVKPNANLPVGITSSKTGAKKKAISVARPTPKKPRASFSSRRQSLHQNPSKKPSSSSSSSTQSRQMASSSIYDESWKEKQQHAFTEWLNYTFQPTEDEAHEEGLQQLITASKSEDSAESEEAQKNIDRAALRSLVIHRRNAQAKKASMELYNEEKFQQLLYAIDVEIKEGRLAVRKDRDMYADLGLRGQLVSLLMSYRSEWLKIGLETIFEGEVVVPEVISKKKNPVNVEGESEEEKAKKRLAAAAKKQKFASGKVPLSRTESALKRFVVQRVLGDSEIQAKYTKGKCKVPSGKWEKLYNDELRKSALRRMIVLFAFLDKSRTNNILDKVPCLFKVSGEVKSTKELLTNLCRDFLSGEGDFIKHLHQLGLDVAYEQKFIDEYDFNVTNLALDLRDGIRLCRMTEILTSDTTFSLSAKLRVPAVSRLQKLHNVGIALTGLGNAGVAIGSLTAKDVVDGNRQGVLSLLWRTIVHFKLGELLNKEVLEQEIRDVRRASKRRMIPGIGFKAIRSSEDLGRKEAELTSLLLTWCQEVCATFGLDIENFTESFADGKALCLLVHYYHPGILARAEILQTTTDLKASEREIEEQEWREAVMNEQKNGRLARKTMGELGGIPSMLNDFDSTCVPEEKSMVACVAYLCSRLIESSSEIQATLVIQSAFRRWWGGKLLELKKIEGAKIWAWWKARKETLWERRQNKLGSAVQKIESFILHTRQRRKDVRNQRLERERWTKASNIIRNAAQIFLAKCVAFRLREERRAMEEAASTVIVRGARMKLARLLLQRLQREYFELERTCAIIIQKNWRTCSAQVEFSTYRMAVLMVQAAARGMLTRDRLARDRFALENAAAIKIQKVIRSSLAQINVTIMLLSVVRIQSIMRGVLGRRKVAERLFEIEMAAQEMLRQEILRNGITKFQAFLRGKTTRDNLAKKTAGAIAIQAFIRGIIVRNELFFNHFAAIELQRVWRGTSGYKKFLKLICSTIVIQSWARMNIAKSKLKIATSAVRKIQTAARTCIGKKKFADKLEKISLLQSIGKMIVAKNSYKKTLVSTVKIQAIVRGRAALKSFNQKVCAAMMLQKVARGGFAREELAMKHFAATEIQRMWRGTVAHVDFIVKCFAAQRIQSMIRMDLARVEYITKLKGISMIQRWWRNLKMAKSKREKEASVVIQKTMKMAIARKAFAKKVERVVSMQSVGRMALAKKSYKKTLASTVKIQAIVRGRAALKSFNQKVCAAMMLQKVARGGFAREELAMKHFAATEIQRMWRGTVAHVDFIVKCFAAQRIQSMIRMDLARVEYITKLKGISMIQRWWRNLKMAKSKREKEASVVIQKTMKMAIARKAFAKKVERVVSMQSVGRMALAKKSYKKTLASTVKIQAIVRGRAALTRFNEMVCASIIAQSAVRAFRARSAFSKSMGSVVAIQSFARMIIAKKLLTRMREQKMVAAAVVLQSFGRGVIARSELAYMNFAATEVQRMFRGAKAHMEYMTKVISAIKIASLVRMYQASTSLKLAHFAATIIQSTVRRMKAGRTVVMMKKEILMRKAEELGRKNAAVKVQRGIRRKLRAMKAHNNASIISRFIRGYLARKAMQGTRRMIVALQSMWRGRTARKQTNKRMRVIRMKIALANKKALEMPEMRLGVRTQRALEVLLTSKRLAEIMRATCTLEVSSRFSERCCEAFSAAGAPEILFKLIRTCNRSLPHIELLQYVLMTIMNVAKWDHLIDSVGVDGCVDVLVDLIQMFRDKETIVVLCGELLITLVTKVRKCLDSCLEESNIKRLEGLLKITMRKAGVTTRVKVKSSKGKGKENRCNEKHAGICVLQNLFDVIKG